MTAMNDRIEQIEARTKAATEGPWDHEPFNGSFGIYSLEMRDDGSFPAVVGYADSTESGDQADAEFIANAREDVPYLLALVREQQATIERVKAVHYEGVAYADDIPEGGDEEVPEDYERHYCNEDGEDWPCSTIAALTASHPETGS